MQWEIFPHEARSGDWVVEGINFAGDGEIYTMIFSGSDAEERAREYFAWKQQSAMAAA
jgi:hypothetical protein